MRLLDFLFPERRNSAAIARDRLKIVLAHERASSQAPDFLPALQKELLDVVGRYIEIRGDMLRVNLARSGETSLLEINVELDGAVIKAPGNGAAKPKDRPAPVPVVVAKPDPSSDPPWIKPG
jgi:cell division topological specificity factor